MDSQLPELVITPTQHGLESPAAYALRVSESNGYFTPRAIAALARHPPRDLFTSRMDVSKIGALLGSPPRATHGYIGPDGTSVILCGQRIDHRELFLGVARVCPECVEQRGYRPAWTDLALVDACPFHKNPFVVGCGACKRQLTWERPGLLRCKCGSDLRDTGVRAQGEVEEHHAVLLRAVVEEFEGSAGAVNAATFQAAENDLTFLDWLGIVRAAAAMHRRLHPPDENVSPMRRAAVLLIDWQVQIGKALHLLAPGESELKGMNLLAKHQQWLAQSWSRALRANVIAFLRRLLQHLPVAPLVDVGASGKSLRLLAWAEPASEKRFKSERASTPRRSATSGSRTFFNRDAAKAAGVPLVALRYLRTSGLFKVNHRANRGDGFHEMDVLAFRADLVSLAKPAPQYEVLIELQHALRVMRTGSADGKGRFVEAVLRGTVPLYAGRKPSFDSLRVSLSDARRFGGDVLAQRYEGSLSAHETAKLLGCSKESIKGLFELRLLLSVSAPMGLRATTDSIAEFQSRYRFLAPLASEWDTSSKMLLEVAKQRDISLIRVARKFSSRPQPLISIADLPCLREAFEARRSQKIALELVRANTRQRR